MCKKCIRTTSNPKVFAAISYTYIYIFPHRIAMACMSDPTLAYSGVIIDGQLQLHKIIIIYYTIVIASSK